MVWAFSFWQILNEWGIAMRKTFAAVIISMMMFTMALAAVDVNCEDGDCICVTCQIGIDNTNKQRMSIIYYDGRIAHVCCFKDAVIDMVLNIDETIKDIKVADYNTGEMISAKEAVWVSTKDANLKLRKSVFGVEKIAFKDKADAYKYIIDHAGKRISFEKALETELVSFDWKIKESI
jgi:hypothetical protein